MYTAIAIGNLTRDPEKTEKGARFGMAVNTNKDVVDYVTVYVYGRQAENALEYLAKGDKVAVSGSLHCAISETDDAVYLNEYLNARDIAYLHTAGKQQEKQPEKPAKRYRG